ncbi:MAG: hypothetical protein EOS21_03160 [Mesorhizobium sp.]|nr:MAG: hypothetical protein EOS21_03160 [Mesorhizobium sp.]
MDDPECFLCRPDPKLAILDSSDVYGMVGLGPITSEYVILAAKSHVRSLADVAVRFPKIIASFQSVRAKLETAIGKPLLMTEHGRVPVCRDDGDQHDQHCFHAHALFFSSQRPTILADAKQFYGQCQEFASLPQALTAVGEANGYFLLSPEPNRVLLLTEPLNAPRQLARTLVAISEGVPDLADWRDWPRYDEALEMAKSLRQCVGGDV